MVGLRLSTESQGTRVEIRLHCSDHRRAQWLPRYNVQRQGTVPMQIGLRHWSCTCQVRYVTRPRLMHALPWTSSPADLCAFTQVAAIAIFGLVVVTSPALYCILTFNVGGFIYMYLRGVHEWGALIHGPRTGGGSQEVKASLMWQ